MKTMRSFATVMLFLLAALLQPAVDASAQAPPTVPPCVVPPVTTPVTITNITGARAMWTHDKVGMRYFDFWVDLKPQPAASYDEAGPCADAQGQYAFLGKLPTDLAPGEHSFQVRACDNFGTGPCSDFLSVPFIVKADGTIVPKTPGNGTIINVAVTVTISPSRP